MDLDRLNALQDGSAVETFLSCCASTKWAQAMSASRPFSSMGELQARAERLWWELAADDWHEAFAAHPRIGERQPGDELHSRWSREEQGGAGEATDGVRSRLREANRAYEQRFGHVYLVCATGRSADEMLAYCQERMHNDPATELRVAAGEQAQITRLRLAKLFDVSSGS